MTVQLENFGAVDSFSLFQHANDASYEEQRNERGNVIVDSFAVFRTGTFKDSMGDSHTWTSEHLAQMVSNFNLLKDSGRLLEVPVRDGHRSFFGDSAPGSGVGRVVGWVNDLRIGDTNVDGEQLLVADFEFTEEDAAEKFRTGTFRARSSEIGMYETNDEEMYWPVFLGFAFVDIGAVEKLFGKSWLTNHQFSQHSEDHMGTPQTTDEETIDLSGGGDPPTTPTPPPTPTPPTPTPPTPSAEGGEEQQEEQEEPVAAAHSAPNPGTFMFRVGGEPTTDFSAVQQHIDTLEGLHEDYVNSTRNDFVNGLAERGVIAATQVETMQEFARGMSPEQYAQFTAMYEDAPANALFANHSGGVTNEDGSEGTTTDPDGEPDELEIVKQRVEYARKSGLSEDELKKLDSYKRLQQLQAAGGSN